MTPIVLAQSSVPYTDVIVAGLLLTSTYFLLAWLAADSDQRRATLLVLAGVAAGIAVGTKLTALPVAATMAGRRGARPPACAEATRSGDDHLGRPIRRMRRGPRRLLVRPRCDRVRKPDLSIPCIDRRARRAPWQHGIDPRSPCRPPRSAATPSRSEVMHSWARDLMLWKTHYVSQGQRLGGLGPLWSYLGAWLTFAMAVSAWRRRKPRMLVFLLVVAVSFVAQPYPWWSRFTILLAAAGSIAIAHAIERAGSRARPARPCVHRSHRARAGRRGDGVMAFSVVQRVRRPAPNAAPR